MLLPIWSTISSTLYDKKLLLTTTSIRVLSIELSDKTDDLRCAFTVVDLEDAPVFEALSYVWGTDDNTTPVNCDGERVLTTPNLAYALRRIRYQLSFRLLRGQVRRVRHLHHRSTHSKNSILDLLDAVVLMILNVTGLVSIFGPMHCVSVRRMMMKELTRSA